VTFTTSVYTVRRGNGSTTTVLLGCWKFSQKNVETDFIRLNLNFYTKTSNSLFEPPFGVVRGNVHTSSMAGWKARGQLPIHDN